VRTVRITLLLACAFLLIMAAPVSAGAPVIEDSTYDAYGPWTWAPCDFTVMEHEMLRVRTMSYYDDAGNLVRFVMHLHGYSVFDNPLNPGVELATDTASGVMRYDFADDTWDVTGVSSHLTIPGYGAVMVRAGRWSDYPFGHDAGKDSFESEEDKQAFCAYLAGTLPLPPKK